jgi:hypothetical protein
MAEKTVTREEGIGKFRFGVDSPYERLCEVRQQIDFLWMALSDINDELCESSRGGLVKTLQQIGHEVDEIAFEIQTGKRVTAFFAEELSA